MRARARKEAERMGKEEGKGGVGVGVDAVKEEEGASA